MIIIPGQGGTYRHLKGRVTHLLADSGQMDDAYDVFKNAASNSALKVVITPA